MSTARSGRGGRSCLVALPSFRTQHQYVPVILKFSCLSDLSTERDSSPRRRDTVRTPSGAWMAVHSAAVAPPTAQSPGTR